MVKAINMLVNPPDWWNRNATPETVTSDFIPYTSAVSGVIEAIPEEDWTPIPYWRDGATVQAPRHR